MDPSPQRRIGVPRWIAAVGTVAIVAHFAAVLTNVAAAPSGPWPGPQGPYVGEPPRAAFLAHDKVARHYLAPLKLTSNYHFRSNTRLEFHAELKLTFKDARGEIVTVTFPDPKAGRRLRHYQQLAASWLTPDEPVMRPTGERIAAEGKEAPTVEVWKPAEGDDTGTSLRLDKVEEHLLPRDQPALRPSEWSMIVVRSYARHVMRQHGADSVEVVRHSRGAVPPQYLFDRTMQLGPDRALQSNYGRFPR